MIEFRRIAVVGVGLIGGSFGLALRRKLPETEVIGVDHPAVLDEAIAAGAVSAGFPVNRLDAAVADADLVLLCAPIREILQHLPAVAAAIRPGALVSDVGSTKTRIVELADRIFPADRHFIGGHPMAGAEGRGVRWADALLFENAAYVLTPSRPLPPELMQAFGSLIERIGAKILLLTPAMHDRVAAAVSHLPQVLAVTLMNLVAEQQKDSPYFLKLAAGGFRDMTRIASSPHAVWEPIVETNREAILEFMDAFIDAFRGTRKMVETGDLKKAFQGAARHRFSIPKDTKGFLRPHHDLLVRVEDRPGVLAAVTAALAGASINIKDIEILKVREGEAGTLRLSFETPEACAEAKRLLDSIGYPARTLE
jgi:prephenate dehydrogenase